MPIALALLSLLALACAGNSPPQAPLGTELELRVGETVALPDDGAGRLTFAGVGGDSRCPVDVTCVWQGDAEVELTVSSSDGGRRVTLHTGVEPMEAELPGGLLARLVELRPRPREGVKIPQEEYVAVLRLSRR